MTEPYHNLNLPSESYFSRFEEKLPSFRTVVIVALALLALTSMVFGIVGQCNLIGLSNAGLPLIFSGIGLGLILVCVLKYWKKSVEIDASLGDWEDSGDAHASTAKTPRHRSVDPDKYEICIVNGQGIYEWTSVDLIRFNLITDDLPSDTFIKFKNKNGKGSFYCNGETSPTEPKSPCKMLDQTTFDYLIKKELED